MSIENPARYKVELAVTHDPQPIAIHLTTSNRLLKVAMVIPERALTVKQADAVCKALNDLLDAEYKASQKAAEAKEKSEKENKSEKKEDKNTKK